MEIAYRTLLDPELRRTNLELQLARRDGAWGVDPLPQDGQLLPGPAIDRFRGRPYVFARQVSPVDG